MNELELVYDSEMMEWPPRLPEQPIFYPVLNITYAQQIAKEWNTKSEHKVGFVTQFEVKDKFIVNYKKEIVGSNIHEELWIPSEELPILNKNIIGRIQVVGAYYGHDYVGFIPDKYMLKNKIAREQFITLAGIFDYNGMDFHCEITANNKAIFLNMLYWQTLEIESSELFGRSKEMIIEAINKVWSHSFPEIKLPNLKE